MNATKGSATASRRSVKPPQTFLAQLARFTTGDFPCGSIVGKAEDFRVFPEDEIPKHKEFIFKPLKTAKRFLVVYCDWQLPYPQTRLNAPGEHAAMVAWRIANDELPPPTSGLDVPPNEIGCDLSPTPWLGRSQGMAKVARHNLATLKKYGKPKDRHDGNHSGWAVLVEIGITPMEGDVSAKIKNGMGEIDVYRQWPCRVVEWTAKELAAFAVEGGAA